MADTIAEFMVALGFKVDNAQQNHFQDALAKSRQGIEQLAKGMTGVMQQFANLATTATGAAIGLGAALIKIGDGFSQLGNAANRIGSAPQHILALEFAMKQLGGTAAEARGMLEGVANIQRENPGLLQNLGAGVGDDPLTAMTKIAARWNQMRKQFGDVVALPQIQQQEKQLGISPETGFRLMDPRLQQQYQQEEARQQTWAWTFQN